MIINNFKTIDEFIEFEEGTYYKFELLVRNTDGHNSLYMFDYSNSNKNILIKSWYVDSLEYYAKIKHEMITLANMTGARLYMTLDRKSVTKTLVGLQERYNKTIKDCLFGSKCSIKSLSKSFASETSKIEASCSDRKTIMFDVDTTDSKIVGSVIKYVASKLHYNPYILQTKKGYHIFCYRKFDCSDWFDEIANLCASGETLNKNDMDSLKFSIDCVVSVHLNNLGLVYYNDGEKNVSR